MIFNYSNAKLSNLIIHSVGNKLHDEGYVLSDSPSTQISPEIDGILTNYFLSPFRQPEFYSFWHESELGLNSCYSFIKDIFESKKSFILKSKNIAKHLYEQSTHPKIKPGEVYISYFKNCVLEDDVIDVIGIFKSESKEVFLKLHKTGGHFEIESDEGLSVNKVDKACLIFNTDARNGYKVCVIDNLSKSNEAQYWKDDFLKLRPCSDNYHFTKNFLSVTKDFIVKKLSEDFDVSKADQIELLNKSVGYFKENETFNVKDFEKNIFNDADMIKSFRKFGSSYVSNQNIDIADTFEISSQAVKKQARIFKSVIKLDKNFHIYIHGNRNLIEQGYDTKTGKRFYKIYFDKES
jgi:hypothetical protein